MQTENWANVQTGSQEIREMYQQESKAAAELRFCATANCVSNNGDINSHTSQKQSPNGSGSIFRNYFLSNYNLLQTILSDKQGQVS